MIERQKTPRFGIIYDGMGVSSVVIEGKSYSPAELAAIVSFHEALNAPITPEEEAAAVRAGLRIEARREIAKAAIAWAYVYMASGDDREAAMRLCNAVGAFLAAGGMEVIG